MTDEHTAPDPETAQEPTGEAGAEPQVTDAWHDVIGQLDALGEAMGRWARATVSDPAHRERAEEIKDHMNKMADTVSEAIDDASRSDIGQQFKEAALRTGEAFKAAGERVGEEVAPRVASAFRVTAEKLHQAAERMETKASEAGAESSAETDPSRADEG